MQLTAKYFHDEEAAREFLEARLWPDGPRCPHCDEAHAIYDVSGRPGLRRCGNPICRRDFTVTIGTIFERSHVPLHKWLTAIYLFSVSKKGISAKQIERMLGVSYKTAWFLGHRIREAAKEGFSFRLGGDGRAIEADETFWGNEYQKPDSARGHAHKMKVVTLVERDGKARSLHVAELTAKSVAAILAEHVEPDTVLNTDDAAYYRVGGKTFTRHDVVNHSAGEYVRGTATTNMVEGYFSLFKRGMIGTYHKAGSQHLIRYCTEFDFRWNTRSLNDADRMGELIRNTVGRRLYYSKIAA
jgi:transposase-like protein